ncbi:ARID DNA-binding domain-containing protein [Tanacetum coccineum]
MMNYKRIINKNWLQYQPMQHWYQSQGTENGLKPIHKRDQIGITRRYMQKETPHRMFPWNSRKKNLSPESKEMLLKRMKEVEAFNASKVSAKARDHGERSASTQKERRARLKPTIKKVAEKIKYPEKVHVITDYMIEGTDDATWNEAWYVSSAYKNHMCPTRPLFKKLTYKFKMIEKEEIEKKFIFSYGVGDVIVEAREGNFVIPNVHYTPEVTLNVLSFDLLEEQGYTVKISNNKCNLHYMFDGARTGKAQEENFTEDDGLKDVVTEHNKFLDKYFESIEPKDEGSLVKGLEELKWDRDDVHDYVDEEYISWNGSLTVIGVMEINLLSLHKIVDSLGGYLCVTLGDKWKTIANLQGLTKDDGEAPKEDVVESSSGNARVKDPQGKEKDDAGIGEALEEDMNKKTQFGVRLEGNLEEEAEERSTTDSNDFEVINHEAAFNNTKRFRKLEDSFIPLKDINMAIGVKGQETRIGDGGFGVVYKGQPSERWQNRTVAIKCLRPEGYQGEYEFRNELTMIFSFNHENIIPFIENRRTLLDMGNIRLNDLLRGSKRTDYLLSGLGRVSVQSNTTDVGAQTLLLENSQLVAKFCDFGIVQNCLESASKSQWRAPDKSRMCIIWSSMFDCSSEVKAYKSAKKARSSFDTYSKAAFQCISFNSKDRPTMEMIVDRIEEALEFHVSKQRDSQAKGDAVLNHPGSLE